MIFFVSNEKGLNFIFVSYLAPIKQIYLLNEWFASLTRHASYYEDRDLDCPKNFNLKNHLLLFQTEQGRHR